MALLSTLVAAAVLAAQARAAGDSILLRVLTTNDFHGSLETRVQSWSNRRPVGGAAAIAGMMDRLARDCACTSIRLDAGDVMQGSPASNLSYGKASVDAFNAMGIAASAVGNHEFDWGVDSLAARARDARFSWLSANLRERAGGGSPPWTAPWRMVAAGPLEIAVVGYSTEETPSTTRPSNVAAFAFDSGPARLDAAIAAARAARPDYVIVVAHAGGFCNRDQGCAGEVVNLARALQHRPDLIVSGHTHSLITTTVNGIPIVQARSNGTALGIVDFVDSAGSRVARVRVETVWADREKPDTAVARVVDGYLRRTEPLARREIASLASPLERRGDQYALGNLIADAYRSAAHADVAIVNNGGIRADLPAGTVTWGQLFEVVPFQNYVVRLRVTGAVLRATLEHAVGMAEARAHVSGIRVKVAPANPAGQRVTAVTFADGRALADGAVYTLAVPDFMAAGGSGYAMLRVPSENTGVVDLDALVEYLRGLPQPVRPPDETRVDDGGAP